jgi:uncharacterized protein YkwD
MKTKNLSAAKCAVLVLLLIVSGFFYTNFANHSIKSAENTSFSNSIANIDEAEIKIFDLVNKERRRNGLNELEWNGELARLARDYSSKMARGKFLTTMTRTAQAWLKERRMRESKTGRKSGKIFFTAKEWTISVF